MALLLVRLLIINFHIFSSILFDPGEQYNTTMIRKPIKLKDVQKYEKRFKMGFLAVLQNNNDRKEDET